MTPDEVMHAAIDAHGAGSLDEALRLYRRVVSEARAAGRGELLPDVYRRIGMIHTRRDALELAADVFHLSLGIAEAHGLEEKVAAALICIAVVETMSGRLGEARELYLRASALADARGDERLVAMTEQNLGVLANIAGEVEAAMQHYDSALRRFESLGDDQESIKVLNNMGMAYVDLGAWPRAEACFDRGLALAGRLRDAVMLGTIETNRAELYLTRGELDRARECCDAAMGIVAPLGSERALGEVHKFYGALHRAAGEAALADAHLASAVELARRGQNRLLEAEALREWALVHRAEERNREALHCLNAAYRLFGELHARRDLLDLDRRLDNLEGIYLRVVQAWGESIESKDRYTAGHCERVATYACLLAEAVGFTGRDLVWFRMGGYLHDVGKIAVPAEVLNKPGKLDDEEWRLMQSHTTEGDAIVAELNFPWDIRPLVRSHHERWGGGGYPDGLRGEEIPLTARILCVADVYDALTTARSYRGAMPREEALRIMEGDVGRIFDPQLFALFRELVEHDLPRTEPVRLFTAAAAVA